jgi:hypothetical protein
MVYDLHLFGCRGRALPPTGERMRQRPRRKAKMIGATGKPKISRTYERTSSSPCSPCYAGRTRNGFTPRLRHDLLKELRYSGRRNAPSQTRPIRAAAAGAKGLTHRWILPLVTSAPRPHDLPRGHEPSYTVCGGNIVGNLARPAIFLVALRDNVDWQASSALAEAARLRRRTGRNRETGAVGRT